MPVREISTKISLDGETEFNKQMEEIDSNLRSLNTELKATTAKFLDAADSEEALAKKSALMNERVDQQEKKLEMRMQAVGIANEVAKKQMKIVQDIASLLGETAADTLIAIDRLKETISDD